MPTYQYLCFECEKEFERFTDMSKRKNAPEYSTCPICKTKKCPRNYNVDVLVKVKGGGAEQSKNQRKLEYFVEKGMTKDQAENFYKESIKASKDRMETMGEVYEKVLMNPEELRARGEAKPVSDEERVKKIEVAKQVTQDAVKKTRFGDPFKGNKQGTLGIVENKGKK